jgi:hypothetical protein
MVDLCDTGFYVPPQRKPGGGVDGWYGKVLDIAA